MPNARVTAIGIIFSASELCALIMRQQSHEGGCSHKEYRTKSCFTGRNYSVMGQLTFLLNGFFSTARGLRNAKPRTHERDDDSQELATASLSNQRYRENSVFTVAIAASTWRTASGVSASPLTNVSATPWSRSATATVRRCVNVSNPAFP